MYPGFVRVSSAFSARLVRVSSGKRNLHSGLLCVDRIGSDGMKRTMKQMMSINVMDTIADKKKKS